MLPNSRIRMRMESGTCNVCAAPCSSCMHYNRSMSAMGSKTESGFSGIDCVRVEEADCSSVFNMDGMRIYKEGICDDLQHVGSETSNFLSTSSSHDSYLENADSRANFMTSAVFDASDDVDLLQVVSSCEFVEEEHPFKRKHGHDRASSKSNILARLGHGSFEAKSNAISTKAVDGNNSDEAGETHSILVDKFCSSASVIRVSSVKSQLQLPESSVCREADSRSSNSRDGNFHKGGAKDTEEIINSQPQKEIIRQAEVNDVESSFASMNAGKFSEHKSSEDGLLERNDTVLEAADRGNCIQTQEIIEIENSDSDVVLDVKVCDICGDAGREDLLAVCSRCSDGAEHTYCMSEMLQEVPDGDWLCEECKIKEMKCQNANESDTASGRLNSACLIEANQISSSTSIPKLAKIDTRTTDLDTQGPSKGLQSFHSDEGKASELNDASLETANPREKPALSRQFSIRNQKMGKMKTDSLPALSDVQSSKGLEPFLQSKMSLSSRSFKGQPLAHSPQGLLSRSISFSYSSRVPKVKTLMETMPHKQKITRESSTTTIRNEGLVKSLTKTTSFKNTTSGRLDTEPAASKNPPFQPSFVEGFRGPKEVKERSAVERKSFSALQNTSFKPSANVSSNNTIKVDTKLVHGDEKIRSISGTEVLTSRKGFSDSYCLGSDEGKKQASDASKSFGSSNGNLSADHLKKCRPLNKGMQTSISAIEGLNNRVEIVSQHSVVLSSECGHKDEGVRDSSISSTLRLSASGGSEKLRCRKCNETGHATQHCAIDNLQKFSIKPAAEANSIEAMKKQNKWREIVNAAMSRSGVLKGSIPNTCDDLQAINPVMNLETASKKAPSGFVESDGLSAIENTLRISAIPKLECIWQGSFNVLGIGKFPEKFDGIQAHLSTCASHRAFEAAIKVPGRVQLEEVSHIKSWPSHFQRLGPQEKNIALFFFAKDAESYERSYRKLMNRMHKNDFALVGNIDGIDLLIFTSNKLPMNSQRWNMMYYLWGMFRARRRNHLISTGDKKKPSVSNLDVELPSQNLSTPLKMMAGEPSNSLVLRPVPSGIIDIKAVPSCRAVEDSGQNSLYLAVVSSNVPQEQPLSAVGNSSSTISESTRISDSPKIMHQTSDSKVKNDGIFQKTFIDDCTIRKTGNLPVPACILGEESSNLRRASSAPLHSPNCNHGDEFSSIEGNLRDQDCSASSVAAIEDDPKLNAFVADCLNKSSSNRKRRRSCSIDGMPQFSNKISSSTTEVFMEDEGERKNYASGSCVTEVNTRLPSKGHALYSGISSWQEGECMYDQPTKLEISRTAERRFFPMDLFPVQNNKSVNVIHVPSEDDDTPESSAPDLGLALGGKGKNSIKPTTSRLPFAAIGGKPNMRLGSLGDDGDDLSASLSLSLGSPVVERGRSIKSVSNKEHVLPEKSLANSTLFMFGSM